MDVYVARQPIFDRSDRVVGYELLHRSSMTNAYAGGDDVVSTARMLADTLLTDRGRVLTRGLPAWINVPAEMLLDGTLTLVPREAIVIELLETIRPTPDVVAACVELRNRGYRLAADDVVDADDPSPLLDVAEIVKVDLRAAAPQAVSALARRFRRSATLLAEKVETRQERAFALRHGYALAQGWYLHEPVVLHSRAVDRTRSGVLGALAAISRDPLEFDEVERALLRDVALTDGILRYVSSAAFAWRRPPTRLRDALVALGERHVRRWVTVAALSEVGADRPHELLLSTLLRARTCEALASPLGLTPLDLFLAGLYSSLPALLGEPQEQVLDTAPLPREVEAALRSGAGRLADAVAIVAAWERGAFGESEEIAARLRIDSGCVPLAYAEGLSFVTEVERAGVGVPAAERDEGSVRVPAG